MKNIADLLLTSAVKCICGFAAQQVSATDNTNKGIVYGTAGVLFNLIDTISGNIASTKASELLIYNNLKGRLNKGDLNDVNHDLKKMFVQAASYSVEFVKKKHLKEKNNIEEVSKWDINANIKDYHKTINSFIKEQKSRTTDFIEGYAFNEAIIIEPQDFLNKLIEALFEKYNLAGETLKKYFTANLPYCFNMIFAELLKHNEVGFKAFQIWVYKDIRSRVLKIEEHTELILKHINTGDRYVTDGNINVAIEKYLEEVTPYLKRIEETVNRIEENQQKTFSYLEGNRDLLDIILEKIKSLDEKIENPHTLKTEKQEYENQIKNIISNNPKLNRLKNLTPAQRRKQINAFVKTGKFLDRFEWTGVAGLGMLLLVSVILIGVPFVIFKLTNQVLFTAIGAVLTILFIKFYNERKWFTRSAIVIGLLVVASAIITVGKLLYNYDANIREGVARQARYEKLFEPVKPERTEYALACNNWICEPYPNKYGYKNLRMKVSLINGGYSYMQLSTGNKYFSSIEIKIDSFHLSVDTTIYKKSGRLIAKIKAKPNWNDYNEYVKALIKQGGETAASVSDNRYKRCEQEAKKFLENEIKIEFVNYSEIKINNINFKPQHLLY